MYLMLKLLHVTAAVLFLGNIITGLFWHLCAYFSATRLPSDLLMASATASSRMVK